MLEQVSIVIPTAPDEVAHTTLFDDLKDLDAEIIFSAEGGRAKSLNVGAARAERKYLWFLHADSRVNGDCLDGLEAALERAPEELHYFDLAFNDGGLMGLNSWGANVRSRVFGLPFGDQGFCLSKALFEEVGGYREDVPYGEDVLFVRKARKKGVTLNRIPTRVLTSARKYEDRGWFRITALHWWCLLKLLRMKL